MVSAVQAREGMEGDLCLAIDVVVIRVLVLADVKEVDAPHGTSLLVSP
jgi:hypothetical protein